MSGIMILAVQSAYFCMAEIKLLHRPRHANVNISAALLRDWHRPGISGGATTRLPFRTGTQGEIPVPWPSAGSSTERNHPNFQSALRLPPMRFAPETAPVHPIPLLPVPLHRPTKLRVALTSSSRFSNPRPGYLPLSLAMVFEQTTVLQYMVGQFRQFQRFGISNHPVGSNPENY